MKTEKEIRERINELNIDLLNLQGFHKTNQRYIINKKIEMLDWVLK